MGDRSIINWIEESQVVVERTVCADTVNKEVLTVVDPLSTVSEFCSERKLNIAQ